MFTLRNRPKSSFFTKKGPPGILNQLLVVIIGLALRSSRESHRHRIHAVTQTRRGRPIVEHVP